MKWTRSDDGFSLLELILGLVVFAIAVLAVGASAGYVTTQIRMSALQTERAAATQAAVEELRSLPYDGVVTRPQADAVEYGDYDVWWDAQVIHGSLKEVQIITRGPGFHEAGTRMDVQDTLVLRFSRPIL